MNLLACKLGFLIDIVASRPFTPRLSVVCCGSCNWCLLFLVGWCGGLCSVLVSEALAAYVVLVPLLLVV